MSINPTTEEIHDEQITSLINNEMAFTLSDIVFRRTGIATGEQPNQALIHRIANIMAAEYNWDPSRVEREILNVKQHFQPLKG